MKKKRETTYSHKEMQDSKNANQQLLNRRSNLWKFFVLTKIHSSNLNRFNDNQLKSNEEEEEAAN